jgi:hypothetical protein
MSSTTPSPKSLGALLLAVAATLICTSALAQWQWVDGTGRKVFSDTPPPAGIPDKSILKRPGAAISPVSTASDAAAAAPAPGAMAQAAAPKLSTSDQELEARKKQAEEAEQAKKKAEAEQFAKARAANCERAMRAKTTMDSGIRVATTNAKGERVVMDDAARAAEIRRLQDVIQSDCGPAQ